mgnify:CR=1 FL=1
MLMARVVILVDVHILGTCRIRRFNRVVLPGDYIAGNPVHPCLIGGRSDFQPAWPQGSLDQLWLWQPADMDIAIWAADHICRL